jgi:phosphodiesterase/alkaline phosphatase D-like protein
LKNLFSFLCFHIPFLVFGQVITHGPVISGVTDSSMRVYIRTNVATPVQIAYYPLNKPEKEKLILSETKAHLDSSLIVDLKKLESETVYQLNISLPASKANQQAQVKTFPPVGKVGHMRLSFGSCIEHIKTDSIFITMSKFKPDLFLHLGDWTYPDHETYPTQSIPGKNYFYSTQMSKVQEAYRVRYSLPFMADFLRNHPIDFIHDDDDFAFDGNSRETHSNAYLNGNLTILVEEPLPEGARENAIQGYLDYFPHYKLAAPKEEGVFHKYSYGNVEIFFLDSRADRSPDNDAFVRRNGRIYFEPPSDHSILGAIQMKWLLDGLRSSTATWKLIASGTNFNKGYKQVMDLALAMQRMVLRPGWSGGTVASSMASMWVGFPHDQWKLINFIAENKISNVVVLSGDSHNSAIDDGKNAGLPELMSGNLGVDNSHICDIVYNKLAIDIWNGGGQGIRNINYNACFGMVDVFGNDSIGLNVIDAKGDLLISKTLPSGFIPKPVKLKPMIGHTLGTRIRLWRNILKLAFNQLFK